MEAVNLFKNAPVQTGDAKRASEMAKGVDGADNAKKMKVAKDFESILIGQLMNQMKETIGESSFAEDGSSKQIQDMFWSFLADEVGSKGGFGLWKNIYKSMSPDQQETKSVEGADEAIMKIDQTA
ncbi:MAG: hypothetical protein FVQ82_01205 [Planctomycetes bacterium]|nr:hypothetical protein [Planctomycetota bacterium]